MRKLSLITLSFLTVSIIFSGCTTITLHPVTDKDIKIVDGFVCMSHDYVKNVMKVKLEAK
jgi:hypothetical protein